MESFRSIEAVIFDLDGTLADTFPLIVRAWNEAVSPHTGRRYTDAEVISRFGIPDPQMIRRELTGDAAEAADETYHIVYRREHAIVKKFDGVDEMLAALGARNVKLGVMTGKGARSAKITVDALGWSNAFGSIITGEDVKVQKPDPQGPLLAAKQLGVDPAACAFVGDNPVDIGAGRNAKMLTVVAGWHPVYLEEIRRMKPDFWAETPMDVLRVTERGDAK